MEIVLILLFAAAVILLGITTVILGCLSILSGFVYFIISIDNLKNNFEVKLLTEKMILIDFIKDTISFKVDNNSKHAFISKYNIEKHVRYITFIVYGILFLISTFNDSLMLTEMKTSVYAPFLILGTIVWMIVIGYLFETIQIDSMISRMVDKWIKKRMVLVENKFDGIANVLSLSKRITDFVNNLKVSFDISYQKNIQEKILEKFNDILKDPSLINEIISTQEKKAQDDLNNLIYVKTCDDEIEKIYVNDMRTVIKTGSSSLIRQFDIIYNNYINNKQEYLTNREWNKFKDLYDISIQELKELLVISKKFILGGFDYTYQNYDSDDPYEIMGVTREMSDEEIKKKYKGLAKELHPDVNEGDREKEEKFKKINDAFDKINKERTKIE